jgi:hypothetical protein
VGLVPYADDNDDEDRNPMDEQHEEDQRHNEDPAQIPSAISPHVAVTPDVLTEADDIAAECAAAAGELLETVPRVAQLAIEAQSLASLLSLLSTTVEAHGTLRWAAVEEMLGGGLRALRQQLPAALEEASATQLATGQQHGEQQEGEDVGAPDASGPAVPVLQGPAPGAAVGTVVAGVHEPVEEAEEGELPHEPLGGQADEPHPVEQQQQQQQQQQQEEVPILEAGPPMPAWDTVAADQRYAYGAAGQAQWGYDAWGAGAEGYSYLGATV